MACKTLIFDLDGTISDPKEGIVKSINHALTVQGYPTQKEEDLLFCIGPPLDQSFTELTGKTDQSLVKALVHSFRERYAKIGYAENKLYPGIEETLIRIRKKRDIRLGLCTSKRVDFAHQILKMFDLHHLFDFIDGGEIGLHKHMQLSQLLEQGVISRDSIMIGDRYIDLEAARKNNLDAAGVLWGYGSHAELSAHQPAYLFETPDQLIKLINT